MPPFQLRTLNPLLSLYNQFFPHSKTGVVVDPLIDARLPFQRQGLTISMEHKGEMALNGGGWALYSGTKPRA